MIIYKVTCLENNKVYIGKTIRTLNLRKQQHLNDAKHNKYCSLLHRAINMYGIDNFCWEVLDTVMFSDLLLDLEKFYIAKYNCMFPNGYNLTAGGEGTIGYIHSMETKKRMSNARIGKQHTMEHNIKIGLAGIGRNHSEETKKKISEANKGIPKSYEHKIKLSMANMGKHLSAETIEKLRIASTGKKHSEKTKKKLSENHLGEKNPNWGKRRAQVCVN